VLSLKESNPNIHNNYAATLEHFLASLTKESDTSGTGLFVTKNDGSVIKIDKTLSKYTESIFTKITNKVVEIPLSELTPESQQVARTAIADTCFRLNLKLSVSNWKKAIKEWQESIPSERIKAWLEDRGVSDTSFLHDAGEIRTHQEYQFDILVSNKSDVILDNLILEYQVFFRQAIAGTSDKTHNYYRFVGYSNIGSMNPREERRHLITPPYITESYLRGSSTTEGNWKYTYTLSYPLGLHQKSSGRMQGIWVRIHRITPYSCLMKECKEEVYPDKTTWDSVELIN
jgi:hypothetical protein